jgi:2-iminobutanoate/2-iminopropanoate deaminase
VKKEVKTDLAPSAIGPYSQAIRTGELIFVSGQIPIDPRTGNPVSGGIKDKTRRTLENIRAILEKEGATLADVVKTTVYLADMSDFGEMNEAYGEFFSPPYPARAAVGARELPRGVSIEMDVIAVGPAGKSGRKTGGT